MSGSWPTARLGDVCDVSRGTTITRKEAVHGDVPVVAGGLEPTYFHNQANRPAGVITVSGSGANAGFVNYWSQPIFASDCSTVIPRDQSALCGRFVFFVLHAMQKFILSDLRQGAAQPHVYAKDIAQLTIPVPPFQEQRSIVRILDDVFSGISTVRANTERNLRSTVEIFECHLQSAFSRHGDAWDRRTLADLLECGWIQSHLDGNHGSDYPRKEEFIESGVPYISANCLVNDRVDMARAKYLSPARASLLRKGIAKHNDVLFAHNATVGPVALLHTEEAKVVLGTSLTYYRCDPRHILPEYLAHFMRSSAFKNQYLQVMRQSTRNQVPITKQREFFHIIPPIVEQKRIVSELDGLLSGAQRLESIFRRKLAALDELKQSLLHQAFSGAL